MINRSPFISGGEHAGIVTVVHVTDDGPARVQLRVGIVRLPDHGRGLRDMWHWPRERPVSTWEAVGVLLALLATVAFLDGVAVLWVRAENRTRERLEREHRGDE